MGNESRMKNLFLTVHCGYDAFTPAINKLRKKKSVLAVCDSHTSVNVATFQLAIKIKVGQRGKGRTMTMFLYDKKVVLGFQLSNAAVRWPLRPTHRAEVAALSPVSSALHLSPSECTPGRQQSWPRKLNPCRWEIRTNFQVPGLYQAQLLLVCRE